MANQNVIVGVPGTDRNIEVVRKVHEQYVLYEQNYQYDQYKQSLTCVSAFVEILLSLQCKIFQYTFLGKYPIKFQDLFSLSQNQQLAWLQIDHKKLGPSIMRHLSDPCIIKLKKKNMLSCCFEKRRLRREKNLAPADLRCLALFPKYGRLKLKLVLDQID